MIYALSINKSFHSLNVFRDDLQLGRINMNKRMYKLEKRLNYIC